MKHSDEFQVVKKTPHPTQSGIYEIEYQMSALDKAGKPTDSFQNKTPVPTKTVYDPKVISDEQFVKWGKLAAEQAKAAGKLTREWTGTTPEGLKFRGYLDDTGAVRSFYVDF